MFESPRLSFTILYLQTVGLATAWILRVIFCHVMVEPDNAYFSFSRVKRGSSCCSRGNLSVRWVVLRRVNFTFDIWVSSLALVAALAGIFFFGVGDPPGCSLPRIVISRSVWNLAFVIVARLRLLK